MDIRLQELVELLTANDDFSSLDTPVLEAIAEKLKISHVRGGDKVVTEGAASDFMFVLASGRLRVSREDHEGNLLLYNEVLPGDCVGEMGLVLGEPRTADITAMRNSVVAKLDRAAYTELVKLYPVELNRVFSLAIYRHLRHQRIVSERRRAQSFLLLSIGIEGISQEFVREFQTSLSKYGKTKVISSSDVNFSQVDTDAYLDLDVYESQNDFLVYVGEQQDLEGCRQIFHHSDQIVYVADGHQSPKITEIEQQLSNEVGYSLTRKHLVLNYHHNEHECASRSKWHASRDVERVYPVQHNCREDYERLIRFLTGNAVGLVLGGGGARGFAHLGVLKAFEEKNIPIDIIGGNSMGALIGACYAMGIALKDIPQRILQHSKTGMKLTVPLISLMSNQNLTKAFQDELGDVKIENLWSFYFSAACNLSKADTTVLDKGPLWRAVLASNSPAGLFPPVIDDGELLVDGAVLENVPVQAMRTRLSTALERRRGNGKVIAIDVDVKDNLSISKDIDSLNNWRKVKSHLSNKEDSLPGMINILMQVAHIGGLTKRQNAKRASDFYLEPPLKDFALTDYKKAEEIIEVGYHYAINQIESWNWHK